MKKKTETKNRKTQTPETDIKTEDTEKKSEIVTENASDLPDPEQYAEEIIESVLFAAGHPIKYSVFANLLNMSIEDTRKRIFEYADKYNTPDFPRGVLLVLFDDCCQLCTKPPYLPYIRAALGIRRNGNLSASSIETLAIIAYNQPVTRSHIDAIRKVDSSYAVNSLLDRGLIESKGRLDAPGRPMLYGTTPDFLRCFGLHSLDELPPIMSEETSEMLKNIGQQLSLDISEEDENQITLDEEISESSHPDSDELTAKNDESKNSYESEAITDNV